MTPTEAIDILNLHGCPKVIQAQLLEAANFGGEICPETLEALVSNWIETKHQKDAKQQ